MQSALCNQLSAISSLQSALCSPLSAVSPLQSPCTLIGCRTAAIETKAGKPEPSYEPAPITKVMLLILTALPCFTITLIFASPCAFKATLPS
ncbi:MAG: hypothetical protein K0R57_4158 [Paenibacillaceae bacterium]|nr:hypothetical protein [Paenibacillaceae bacterium]